MRGSDQQRLAALAADPALHRAFRWLHLQELQLRRWQLEFLAIPAPPFGETDRACWFRERFRALGLAHASIDEEGNAIAWLPGESLPGESLPGESGSSVEADSSAASGRAVLLSAHLDTVFPAGTDCTPHEEGAIIRCPGACDNGAGLAALLGIAAALQFAGLRPATPVLFSANVGEEGEGDLRGMRHLFARPPFDARIEAAIALEGAGNALVVDRALGSRRLRVTITGPGGHSWADAGRPNPILALGAALLAVSRLPLPTHPRTTLNVGRLEGGTSVNSIPSAAFADIDLRSTSALELDRLELSVLTHVSAAVEAEMAAREPSQRLYLHIERTGSREVGALPRDAALAGSLRAVDRHLGISTEARIGSTDANHPLFLGIPALAIGAGGTAGGLHTPDEWYDPTGRELALRRILMLLLDTCSLLHDGSGTPETHTAVPTLAAADRP